MVCPYAPLPPSLRDALLPELSWWAGKEYPENPGSAVALLRYSNWDESGAWSAQRGHELLCDLGSVDRLCEAVAAGGFHGLYLLLGGLYPFDAPLLAAMLPVLAAELHRSGHYLLLGLDAEEPSLLAAAASADRVVLLSPAQSAAGSIPRPNAALDALDKALASALRLLPSEKLLLGLSDYGTLWSGGEAHPLSSVSAIHRAAAGGLPIRWDAASGECCLRDTDAFGRDVTVWFPDLRSLSARLTRLEEAGLAGLALQPGLPFNTAAWSLLHSRFSIKTVSV